MVEALALKISKYLVLVQAAEEDDQEVIAYGMFHILSSALQIGILVVFAIIFDVLLEITAYAFCFTSLKRYIGGTHATKHWMCLWGFTFLAFVSCFICGIVPYYFIPYATVAATTIMLVLIMLKAPVPHPNNPKSKEKLKKLRKISISFSLIQFSVILLGCIFLPESASLYLFCGAMGGLTSSITLLLPMPS